MDPDELDLFLQHYILAKLSDTSVVLVNAQLQNHQSLGLGRVLDKPLKIFLLEVGPLRVEFVVIEHQNIRSALPRLLVLASALRERRQRYLMVAYLDVYVHGLHFINRVMLTLHVV